MKKRLGIILVLCLCLAVGLMLIGFERKNLSMSVLIEKEGNPKLESILYELTRGTAN